jgi:4-amino-4-deoxy-L-arabinose transferase-like glycosyltransferase
MTSPSETKPSRTPLSFPKPQNAWSSDAAILIYLALATILVQWLLGGRFGFHRDELATLEDARHLAWGYIAYPPITPFFGRISLILFGTSISGFRFFASVAQATSVVLTGLMARELGGRRGAQLVAAAAAIPFCIASGALMQYVAFDYVCWVLTAYFVIRLLKSDDPRWWLAIGTAIGLGMMSKYTMGFFAIGITVGVLATNTRRHLASKWLWTGVALSLLVFLPNLLWQVQHHFISLDFLHDIHQRDVRIGRAKGFLPDQLKFTLLAVPLWLAGLYFYLFSKAGSRFRMLGWMYIVPLVLFVVAKGRGYYLGPAYPMLYAAGSVWGEQRLQSLRRAPAAALRTLARVALTADILIFGAIAIPPAPINSTLWNFASKNNGDLLEEVGWPELVQAIAQIRDSLPAEDRSHLGILAANYGEAGAVNLYGPAFGLPPAISGVNSFWAHGYGSPPPQTLIVLGFSPGFLQRNFASCQIVAHTPNPYNIENEETREHPNLYVCRGLRQSWPDFWKGFHYYG